MYLLQGKWNIWVGRYPRSVWGRAFAFAPLSRGWNGLPQGQIMLAGFSIEYFKYQG